MTNSTHSWSSHSITIQEQNLQQNRPIFERFKFNFVQGIQGLFASLMAPSEPQIGLTFDRSGNPNWKAYDPVSGDSVSGLSELEMRQWLETRYYR